MAIAIVERKAGIAQFTDRKVRDPRVVEMMKRVTLVVDPELEALGYDQVRSRVTVKLKDCRTLTDRADGARGHPEKPMSWGDPGGQFRDCCRLALPRGAAEEAIGIVAELDKLKTIAPLIRALGGRAKPARRAGNKKWSAARKN